MIFEKESVQVEKMINYALHNIASYRIRLHRIIPAYYLIPFSIRNHMGMKEISYQLCTENSIRSIGNDLMFTQLTDMHCYTALFNMSNDTGYL